MPKTERKQKETDEAQHAAKALSKSRKEEIKEKIKEKSREKVAEATRSSLRMKAQKSAVAFGGLAILDGGPHCTLFDTPDGAPTKGARGCKRAEVVLGPLAGWPELQRGTDAKSVFPDAITDVRLRIDDAKYSWKSGHVINADFGGVGTSNDNMTCLTSSANKAQQAFDNHVKDARSSLHQVYSALRLAFQQGDSLKKLGYGIKVEIEMSDEAWGDKYPWNCVSTSMSLEATIVGEPAEADIRTLMEGRRESEIQGVLGHIAAVRQHLVAAAQCKVVDNRP